MKVLIEFDSMEDANEFLRWKDERKASAQEKRKTPLRDAGLMCRTFNCLHAENFEYLEDAQATPARNLLKIPNFGKHSLRDLMDAKPNA